MYCYKNTLKKQIMLQVIVLGLCDFEKYGTKEIKVWAYDGDLWSVCGSAIVCLIVRCVFSISV